MLGSQGFWDMTSPLVSSEYTDFLHDISALCSRLIVGGVPTLYIRTEDERSNVQTRNEALRRAVQSMGSSKALFFDYDQLARLPNAPPNDVGNNWHYQCHWEFMCGKEDGHNTLALTSECVCEDDMNLSIWQIFLNSICRDP